MSARFLSTQGVPIADAVVSGLLVSIGGFVVQVALLLVSLALVGPDFDLALTLDGGDTARIALFVLLGAGLIISLIWLVPALHRRVVPHLRGAATNVRSLVTNPRRLALVIGGNLMSQLIYAIVLGLCVEAYGYHLNLGLLIVVNTCATVFAGVMPVPGGMGVSEAALTAGLTAAGLPSAVAAAAAITHRLITFYLPPAWGWLATRWLTKRGYL
jgi:uncharacterized protein (TIRG00374 family)